mgnify:CR=1 FL=1
MAGKKTGKRLLTWVLVLVMALSLLPVSALAADGTIVYGGVTLYTEKRPQRYTFLRSNGENAVTKNVGDTGFYQRLPRDTYVHTSCGTVLADFIPDYYSASTTTVELSDPTVLKDLSWTISGWNGNDEYKGFPCLTFNFTAAKPGTTTVKLTFYYNYDHGGEIGHCNGCGGLVQYKANLYWWQETTTFTVTVTGEEEKPEYTLTYHENTTDPVTNMPDPKTVTLKSSTSPVTFTVSGNKPGREGYTFLGWAGNPNATEPTVKPSNTITTPATATNLYAVWQSKTPPTDKPAKPTENDVTGVVVDIVCVTTTGTHDMVQYPLGYPADAQHTIGEVVSDGAGGYICPVTVRTAWFVRQASDLVWKVQHTQTASTITFNLTYDKNSETWVKPAASPRIEATHEVTPDAPGNTKPDFENEEVNIRVQCTEYPSMHDPCKKNYGILSGAYTDNGVTENEGTYVYTIKLDRAKYIAQFDEDIHKPHTDTEPNEDTYIKWQWEAGAWHLIGGPDGVDADIKVKCGQTETPPEAPTADELEKLEMAVQVKCVVDDSQQHKDAYDLLGKYDEDYFVAPKKDGDDWLCEISYDPDLYVAEFNTAFPNLKHVRNDEKIVPVTLIWADGSWQLKTQGSVHVTEEYTVTFNAYGGFPTPNEQHVKSGEKAVLPAEPTLKGHTFAFWYLGEDEENATAYDFDTPVTGDITLTAKWNINKYTVTFNSYGGTPVPPAQEVEYGLTAAEPATAPTKTGYTFDGWYLGDEKYDFSDAVEQNITLYANWEKNIYTVTYTDGVDGEEVFADQTDRVPFEDTTPAFKGTKTRAGYVFAGWKPAFSDTVTGNVTYVAQWKDDKNNNGIADDEEEKYTVTYTDGVANEEVFADQVYGDLLSGTATPAFKGNPTRDGYVFDGWKPAFSDTVTGNVTYVAQWTARTDLSYTVHYYLKNTTKQVANDKMVAGQTFNADVTENAIRISGYRVYGDSVKSITIGTGTNEIIFYYTRAYHPSTPSKPTLNTGDHYAYVMGYPDGTVRPNGSITRAEVSAILFRLLSDETRDEYFTTESSFTDVKAGAWYNNSIATLEKAGVIVDTAKGGAFRPNEAITRAELAAMLAQFSDAKPVKGVKFSDVSAEHWAYEAIAIAAKMGWIEGYPDGTFRPDATITRAEMMTLVNRALERVPSDEDHLLSKRVMLTFPDCKSGDWFYIAVQEATNSHTYERAATEKNGDEQWIALRANRDWTQLEK